MSAGGVRRFVHGVLRAIFRPLPKEKVWEWAERELKIPGGAENAEMAGRPWSSSYSPYVRDVMEWFREPGKQSLAIRKSSATGFTMAMLIVICWKIRNFPGNVGYYIDSEKEARNISKGRLKRWILDNKLLEEVGEADEMSNLTYFLRGMVVYLMGSFSSGAYRNKQLSVAILDELDAHPTVGDKEGQSWDLVDGRLKKDKNSKKCGFSTPILETGQMEKAYQAGTQEKYFVPCPHCGTMQPLEWKQVKYKGPEFEDLAEGIDLAKVKEGAYYECDSVGACRIEHTEKWNMLLAGEWRATNPKAAPGVRSMHISDLYSNFVTWGELAVEWLGAQANLDKLKAFVNQRLGEPFRQSAGTLKESDVLGCRQTTFKRGECPIVPVLMGLMVDVQQASLKWAICAFTRTGDMLVVDWGERGNFDELEELVYKDVPVPGGVHRIDGGLIDEGDGNTTEKVRSFTIAHASMFPVKGRGDGQQQALVDTFTTWLQGQWVLTYKIKDPAFKSELLYNRIAKNRKRKDYETGRLILPWRVTEEFVAELLNERQEVQKNRFGFEEIKWVKSGPNDWLDCLKYGLAFWAILEPVLREAGRLDTPAEAA